MSPQSGLSFCAVPSAHAPRKNWLRVFRQYDQMTELANDRPPGTTQLKDRLADGLILAGVLLSAYAVYSYYFW
jgi:hypothetical protein